MSTVYPSSPPRTSGNDTTDFTHLRKMYKHYMLNPSVASWLLSRDALTDFHVVRKDKSVMQSISSVSAPRVIPPHAPDVPFPASSDLMFLDHVHDGFALGHIWGSFHTDTHPYAPLAARAGKSGWDQLRSRKFASDLAVNGVLEIVEYTWFADNRAMVILSQIPCQPDKRIVRTSEVLFFDATERTDIPPQRPSLVLLVHDRSMCTACGKEICACPNTIGIDRGTMPDCHISRKTALSNGKFNATTRIVRSWEDRARVVAHGNKRGLLSIVYGGSFAGSFSQITVRQAYVSVCEDQDAIGRRIQQHLARLLCRIPPISSTEKSVPYIVALPGSGVVQEGAVTFTEDASSQSPTSCAQKGMSWLDSAAHVLERHSDGKQEQKTDNVKQGYCSGSTKNVRHNCSLTSGLGEGTSCGKRDEPNIGESPAKCCKPSTDVDTSEKGSTSLGSRSIADCAPSAGATSEHHNSLQHSLCGPEKAGKDCDCSAEKMQDPILARILNSGRDQLISQTIADAASSVQPMFPRTGDSSLFQSMPSMNPTALLAKISTEKQHQVDNVPTESSNYDNMSPNSIRCGTSTTTAPSPTPESTQVQGEPALKRSKIDSVAKPESFGFGLQAGWHGTHEDRENILSIPSWGETGGSIERPLSALGRAMGVTTNHSPFALVSPHTNTPTPPAVPIVENRFALGKTTHTDFDFNLPFDPLPSPIPRLNETLKRPDTPANVERQTEIADGSGLQQALQPMDQKRTDFQITESATASGVWCDICGIKFAKRSNKIRHIQTVHNRVKQFECDICGTKFGLKADLGRHRFRIHESRAFQCDSCGKSFAEQEQLKHHVRVTHEEDSKPWECKTCLIRFGRKSTLTRHEQTVHQQTRFACRFCKKSYSQRFDAVRHERRVHGVDDKSGSSGIK